MLFTEGLFFAFYPLVFIVHWMLPSEGLRKTWLLILSYVFYSAWDWRFLFLIILSTIVDFLIGIAFAIHSEKSIRRALLATSVAVNLGILAAFKYFNFFSESLNSLIASLGFEGGLPLINVVLPVGISFYTFQTLSYTIDVYRGKLEATRSPVDFALFVAFFPQLVAGPIVRASDFLSQMDSKRCWRQVDHRGHLALFLSGFIKKACVADNLAPFVDAFFSAPGDYDQYSAIVCVFAYAVQIYCDFSGYSEMAIASAGLLGYRLCDNFFFPYFSQNIAQFWRRWHISLSTWLRDYLYFSLGGNRCSKLSAYRNLMLTMLLGGLWHGASWNFIAWGGMHGAALIVHKFISSRPQGRNEGATESFPAVLLQILRTALTFTWVCLAWIPFRSQSFSDTYKVLETIFLGSELTAISIAGNQTNVLAGFLVLLAFFHWRNYSMHSNRQKWRSLSPFAFAVGYGVAWSIALATRSMEETPFIYFQF